MKKVSETADVFIIQYFYISNMARNTNTIDYREDYYRGLSKIYFEKIITIIIAFGDLRKGEGLILDFGCGLGHLKKRLQEKNVIGYDIIPELSDVADYKTLTPSKIVLSGVLEHMYIDEIEKLLHDFIQMNPYAELLIFLPTENFVSKIAMHLAGQVHAHDDHISKYKDINKVIEKYYYLKKRKYIFLHMGQISHYVSNNIK
jgi:SAM-dependent methyltransferase